MLKKKKSVAPHLTKQQLIHADPNLNPPTMDIEKNLEEGKDDLVPDPDNIPGGYDVNGAKRPDLITADAQAIEEEQEDKDLQKK